MSSTIQVTRSQVTLLWKDTAFLPNIFPDNFKQSNRLKPWQKQGLNKPPPSKQINLRKQIQSSKTRTWPKHFWTVTLLDSNIYLNVTIKLIRKSWPSRRQRYARQKTKMWTTKEKIRAVKVTCCEVSRSCRVLSNVLCFKRFLCERDLSF